LIYNPVEIYRLFTIILPFGNIWEVLIPSLQGGVDSRSLTKARGNAEWFVSATNLNLPKEIILLEKILRNY
jgi:hypothetical protein